MKRIFPSMAALAFLTVVATAQEQTVTIVSTDGQTVTVNGKTYKVEPGKPLTIDGKTIKVVKGAGPLTTVRPGTTTRLVIDGKGNLVRVKDTAGDQVVIVDSTNLKTFSTPVKLEGTRFTTVQTPVVVDGKVQKGAPVRVTTPRSFSPVIVQGQPDDREIAELTRKIAELQRQLHELMMKKHGGRMAMPPGNVFVMPQGQDGFMKLRELEGKGFVYQFDEKKHKEMMDKLHKELGQHKLDSKQHMELMEKLRKDFGPNSNFYHQFDEKKHKEMMDRLHKELGQHKLDSKQHMELMEKLRRDMPNKRFEFNFDDKMNKELFEKMRQGEFQRFHRGEDGKFYVTPAPRGKQPQGKEAPKRFFDEPMFRTPEPAQKEKAAPGRRILREDRPAAQALREAAVAREQAAKVRSQALREAAVARQEALKDAAAAREAAAALRAKAVQGTRAPGRNDAAVSEMRARIAALEAQIRALKEENARLKRAKNPPPPKVEVKSKRIR